MSFFEFVGGLIKGLFGVDDDRQGRRSPTPSFRPTTVPQDPDFRFSGWNPESLERYHYHSTAGKAASSSSSSSASAYPPGPASRSHHSTSPPNQASPSFKTPAFSSAPPKPCPSPVAPSQPLRRPPVSSSPAAPPAKTSSVSYAKPCPDQRGKAAGDAGVPNLAPPPSSSSSSSFSVASNKSLGTDGAFNRESSVSGNSSGSSAARHNNNSLPSVKPTLRPASSDSSKQDGKAAYVLVQKEASPVYVIPEDVQDLVKKGSVPGVLNKPLSPSTYKHYFASLLYAEDFYIEKWSDFKLENVALQLQEASIYNRKNREKLKEHEKKDEKKDEKTFVAFEIDSVPERRPFLLSRDFVFVRPSINYSCGKKYQGFVYRVVKSNTVLVEFGDDFFSQHRVHSRYDVSFSFNRVCLKRCHQALEAVSHSFFQSFLFPEAVSRKSLHSSLPILSNPMLDHKQKSAVQHILRITGAPPYLINGDLCMAASNNLSRTGLILREAATQIYRTHRKCRILIAAPVNRICDLFMRSLMEDIPESKMFRANAAFRELDGVPCDILPACLYKGECFACPPLHELQQYKVILSTSISGSRLWTEGIRSGHFTHIFLVDASSATEPEVMVTLANLADEKTTVVVSGAERNCSSWVRSDIARRCGLKKSYFERLLEREPYRSLDPKYIMQMKDY